MKLSEVSPVIKCSLLSLVFAVCFLASCKKEHVCKTCDPVNKPPATVPSSDTINECNTQSRPLAQAKLVPLGILSETRADISISISGKKILFAGGYNNPNTVSSRVDIYDIGTNAWTTAELSLPRWKMAAATSNNKIFFAGGYTNENSTSSRVDIYDVITNSWSKAELSTDRTEITAGAGGGKVLFAGGAHAEADRWVGGTVFSDRVDILDVVTNTWSVASLSEKRRIGMASATIGDKIYFAGGTGFWNVFDFNPTNKIDIYNISTNTWTSSQLHKGRGALGGIAVNNKLYWAGGSIYDNLPEDYSGLEIKDVTTQAITLNCLFQPNSNFSTALRNNKIVFFTGTGIEKNKFDIYDISTNAWSIGILPQNVEGASIISSDNNIYVAGGKINGILSNQVWKLEF